MKRELVCCVPVLLAGILVSSGCIPVPEDMRAKVEDNPTSVQNPADAFQGLDPGGVEIASQHFATKAYGSDRAKQISDLSETIYNRLMSDTGLYTFQPPGLYNIWVYSGRDEYVKKTQQADWSDGAVLNKTIYLYDGNNLGPSMSHYMAHLIFVQYMSSPRQDIRWLNEGLAVYEENQEMIAEGLRADWRKQWQLAFRTRAIPFDQLTTLPPATERDRVNDLWYQETGDVVRFMIEQGGRNGFSQFLGAVRDGHSVDDAIHTGFSGVWTKLSDVESAWKLSL